MHDQVDGTFCLSGRKLVRGYLMSYGHMPLERTNGTPSMDAVPDFGLIKAMDRCHYDKSATFKCPSVELKNSDLLISTERLRADLRAAATILCSCSTEERRALQSLADESCFANVPLHSARSRRFQYGDASPPGGGNNGFVGKVKRLRKKYLPPTAPPMPARPERLARRLRGVGRAGSNSPPVPVPPAQSVTRCSRRAGGCPGIAVDSY